MKQLFIKMGICTYWYCMFFAQGKLLMGRCLFSFWHCSQIVFIRVYFVASVNKFRMVYHFKQVTVYLFCVLLLNKCIPYERSSVHLMK